jgi:hypothetical protein
MKVTHFPPLIILMAFLINGFAVADDCTTADLNSSSSSPLRSVPVYDQDGTGTCYAHVAAQLVSYRELKRGQGKEAVVNPIYAAYIDHCVARDQQTLDSGNVSATINSLRALGSCSATGVQTCLKGLKSKSNMTDAEIAYYVQTLFAKYEAEKKKTPFDYTGATNRALAIMKADKRVGDRCDKLNETYKPLLWSWNWMSAGVAFDAIFEGCAPRRSLFATPPPSTTNA